MQLEQATHALALFSEHARACGLGRYELCVTLALRAVMLMRQGDDEDRRSFARYLIHLSKLVDADADVRTLH
jgi:hypothetical protein